MALKPIRCEGNETSLARQYVPADAARGCRMKHASPRTNALSRSASASCSVSKRMTLIEKTSVHLLSWGLGPFGVVARAIVSPRPSCSAT